MLASRGKSFGLSPFPCCRADFAYHSISVSFDVPKLVKNLHSLYVFENKNAERGDLFIS